MKLFIDGHAAESGVEFVVLRSELDFERSGGVRGHGSSLLTCGLACCERAKQRKI